MSNVIDELARIASANEATQSLLTNELSNNAANNASIVASLSSIAATLAVSPRTLVIPLHIWVGGSDNDPLASTGTVFLAYIPERVVVRTIATLYTLSATNDTDNCWRATVVVGR